MMEDTMIMTSPIDIAILFPIRSPMTPAGNERKTLAAAKLPIRAPIITQSAPKSPAYVGRMGDMIVTPVITR